MVLIGLGACASPDPGSHGIPVVDSFGPGIEWDPDTLTLIQVGGCYGRMIRLDSGEWLACFESGSGVAVRRSADEGRTWGEPVGVAASSGVKFANPELLKLRDGTVLCFYNERPDQAPRAVDVALDRRPPFAIGVVRSEAGSRVWGEPSRLYSARNHFHHCPRELALRTSRRWQSTAVEPISDLVAL